MLASFPASMLNQNSSDLGILNRFKLDPSRSRQVVGAAKSIAKKAKRIVKKVMPKKKKKKAKKSKR